MKRRLRRQRRREPMPLWMQVREVSGTMGGEDFAYFAEKVPSTFFFLGIGNEAKNSTAGLHR